MVTNSLTPGKLHSKYIYSSRKNKSDKILSAAVIPRGQLHDIQRYKGIRAYPFFLLWKQLQQSKDVTKLSSRKAVKSK